MPCCGRRLDGPARPCLACIVLRMCIVQHGREAWHGSMAPPKGCTTTALLIRRVTLWQQSRHSRPCLAPALNHSLAGAGTPEEACARRWLRVQGGAVKCLYFRYGFADWTEDEVPGRDLDGGRLSTLLASLPALTSVSLSVLATLDRGCSAAAILALLAGAARALGRCSSLQQLRLYTFLSGRESDELPEALPRELARAHTLEEVDLRFQVPGGCPPGNTVTFSLAHLVAGLAGLTRLRALSLTAGGVGMEAALPACLSCLAQLTSLTLSGLRGLRCAPGWAHLPALACLAFEHCAFAGNGEAALLGINALVALTSLSVEGCPGLRVLPTSLWRLSQLCSVLHRPRIWDLAGVPRSKLPDAGLPLSGAPCFASLSCLSLTGHDLLVFPPGILTARRLTHLNLSLSCFEQLPEGVSALTALEELHLGRHAAGGGMEVGGTLDARALGSLAGFPCLRSLTFVACSVLLCPSFQAAAAHPRLTRLQLCNSYPDRGPSCGPFLGVVITLLQRGRLGVLELSCSDVTRGSETAGGSVPPWRPWGCRCVMMTTRQCAWSCLCRLVGKLGRLVLCSTACKDMSHGDGDCNCW